MVHRTISLPKLSLEEVKDTLSLWMCGLLVVFYILFWLESLLFRYYSYFMIKIISSHYYAFKKKHPSPFPFLTPFPSLSPPLFSTHQSQNLSDTYSKIKESSYSWPGDVRPSRGAVDLVRRMLLVNAEERITYVFVFIFILFYFFLFIYLFYFLVLISISHLSSLSHIVLNKSLTIVSSLNPFPNVFPLLLASTTPLPQDNLKCIHLNTLCFMAKQ